jgi:hypothetical protein
LFQIIFGVPHMADLIGSLRRNSATPARQPTSDTPIPLGLFHSVAIDHARRTVTFSSLTPSEDSPQAKQALQEGADGCNRLAVFWSAQGYRIFHA